jgi:hypothetical protein
MGRRFLINTAVLVVALVIVSAVIIAAMNVPQRGGAAGQSFFDQFIISGGPIVWFVLLPMSLLTVFLAAEHFITIRRKKLLPDGTGKEIIEVIRQFGPQQLETRIKDRQDFVSIAAVKAVTQGRGDWFRMRSALDESLQEQSWALVRKIEWLNLPLWWRGASPSRHNWQTASQSHLSPRFGACSLRYRHWRYTVSLETVSKPLQAMPSLNPRTSCLK